MTGNLIPTPRVDKNGRTVVRHMKPQTGGGAAQVAFPPIAIRSPQHDEQLHEDATQAIVSGIKSKINGSLGDRKSGEIREMVSSFSPHTLQGIVSRESDATVMLEIYKGMDSGWDEFLVNDYVNLADVIARNKEAGDYDGFESDLKALRYYDGLCPQLLDAPYPNERRSQCEAIMDTLRYIHTELDMPVYKRMHDDNRVPFIADEGLRNLLVKSENREVAVRIIKERGILDAEHISELMNTDSVALSEGSL